MEQDLFLALLFLNLITTALVLLRRPEGRRRIPRVHAVEPHERPDFTRVMILAKLNDIDERLKRVEDELERSNDLSGQGPAVDNDPPRVREWEYDQ
jgi:hypothetical protein